MFSRNPTRPGNPNLNDTSSTPENRVQLFSTKISKDPIRLASKIRLNGLRQSSSVFNQTKGQLTVPRPVRAERSGWADGLQIWASVWLGFVNSKQLSVGKWWQRKVAFLRPNLKSHPSEVGQNALGQHVPSLKKKSKFWKMNKPSPGHQTHVWIEMRSQPKYQMSHPNALGRVLAKIKVGQPRPLNDRLGSSDRVFRAKRWSQNFEKLNQQFHSCWD